VRRDSADENTVVAVVGRTLASGSYRVIWRVAARDGHPIRGAFTFTVTTPGADTTNGPPVTGTPLIDEPETVTPAVAGALGSIFIRWLAFISIFLAIGSVVFRRFVILPAPTDPFSHIASNNAATLGLVASVAAVLAAILKLARESSDMPDIAVSTMLFGSTWGLSIFVTMLAGLVAAAGFRAAHSNDVSPRRIGWTVASAAAMVLGITPAFGGHAIGGDTPYLAVPADIVHVIAGSAWLGTLAVILIVGIPAALKAPDDKHPGGRVATLINRFSPIALLCGGAVVATGVGSSVIRLPRLDSLWTTIYGFVLILKLVFVLFLFGAGAWNWRRMKPRLTGDNAISPMRSSASFELLLASIVLVLTAVLVALETP
jgi:copper transport protein